jgi:hypothetical protein
MFLWNKDTSALRPMFWANQDDGAHDSMSSTNSTSIASNGGIVQATTMNDTATSNMTSPTMHALSMNSTGSPTNATAPLNMTDTAVADAVAKAAKAQIEAVADFETKHDGMANDSSSKFDGINEKIGMYQSSYVDTASHPPLGARSPVDAPVQNVTLVFRPDVPKVASVDTGIVGGNPSNLKSTVSVSAPAPTVSALLKPFMAAAVESQVSGESSAPALSASLASSSSASAFGSVSSVAPSSSAVLSSGLRRCYGVEFDGLFVDELI